ncbi:pyridine nucleotide-disulfide oxidoreductase domain-containing protein 1 [Microplitis demolitor]|uniref:pyridine nucleotide-disulfide oxidoreductase domain-containing protein 1 n=1 Tax=Microplitis demolitor TaxID=69319 RepID=UPI0004CCD381|nr:pyridine nucleotide-disulfide oxidoreductase domain-containing protein 1 [Microplitis demolitor]
MMEAPFVIVGGGIAGVSCAESISFLARDEKIILISASPLVKTITNVAPIGMTMMKFDVEEKESSSLTDKNSLLTVVNDIVTQVNINDKTVRTEEGLVIKYNKLCLCNGAKARVICENNPYVIGIRDTESVENFSRKITNARRIIVVGNGGIATEVVHEVENVEVIWVIKDKHISATFVDPGAAEFFHDKLTKDKSSTGERSNICKRFKYTITEGRNRSGLGAALGPDWHESFARKGLAPDAIKVQVEYESEVTRVLQPDQVPSTSEDWPVYAELTNGKTIGCDFIISATGVTPNVNLSGLEELTLGEDGGFLVDWKLETSATDVYAAGDVCSVGWDLAPQWFQMRLWTQAHQMGRYAAKTMVSSYKNERFLQDFCFELFTHVTTFFGYKVVLLGLYNGQKLGRDYEILLRMTKGLEYVKLVMKDNKLQGAVLIGDTDLEEMCENLILNQLDLSIYGEDLLNPDIDIEDYFD